MSNKRIRSTFSFKTIGNDLPAGIVVFLVALPLCLGIALACNEVGVPLFAGIIAGIVGGTIVAFISKSPLGVSGPAAGLIAIIISAVNDLGSFEIFLLAVIISGVIQILLGAVRAGIMAYYFPSSVIKGMLAGIGIVIFLKQIPIIMGYDVEAEGTISFFQKDGHNTISELYYMLDNMNLGAIFITFFSLVILRLWETDEVKSKKIFTWMQGPLFVVLIGVLLTELFSSVPLLAQSNDQIVNIPVASNFEEFKGLFKFPDFANMFSMEWETWQTIIQVGFLMAVVASLETLLCVEATDKLDPNKRVTPANRELVAQGVGNIVSGILGGLPITQVIVRSSANIQSGGKTRMSAIIHGFLLLLSALFIPKLLNKIPYAALASILLVVGYKLANPKLFKSMYKEGWSQFIPFIITVLVIVFKDLLWGISVGLVVAFYYVLYNNFKRPYFFKKTGDAIYEMRLAEDVSFLNKAKILVTLNSIPRNSKITVDATRSVNIDRDVLEIFEDFKEHALTEEIEFEVLGIEKHTKSENEDAELINE